MLPVSSVTITSEANSYGEIAIDDGSGETQLEDSILNTDSHLATELGTTTLTGQTLASVTGVVRYAYSSLEIHPRDAADSVARMLAEASAFASVFYMIIYEF